MYCSSVRTVEVVLYYDTKMTDTIIIAMKKSTTCETQNRLTFDMKDKVLKNDTG